MTRRPPPTARPPAGFASMATDLVRVAPLPNRFSRDSIPSALPASLLPPPAVPCRPHPYPLASGQRQDKARVRLCRPHLPGIIGMPLLSSPWANLAALLDHHEQRPL
ncbi:hypothetical protein PVAP13_2KG251100 [Panicum virgatum]|uniref:Uncharacterized protein n=1 Tax=Panicum virgatum TaxID=38727 RepID=A0A8T0W9W3_PANVG|nr:hypothetical protein PVAP13_2KG251100 [Panicum virgatum]